MMVRLDSGWKCEVKEFRFSSPPHCIDRELKGGDTWRGGGGGGGVWAAPRRWGEEGVTWWTQ